MKMKMKIGKYVNLWKKVCILLMIILLFSGFVEALGVTPARKLFDFDEIGVYEGSFTVVGGGGVKKVSVNVITAQCRRNTMIVWIQMRAQCRCNAKIVWIQNY